MLLAVVETVSGDLPSGLQTDVVSAAETKGKQLQLVLAKAKIALTNLHEVMLPESAVPGDLEGLVDVFHKDDAAIESFSYAQTERGECSLISVSMAHGAQVDFNTITSTFPVGVDGKPVSLKKFTKAARQYAQQLSKLIQAREAEKKAAAAKKAPATSESADA